MKIQPDTPLDIVKKHENSFKVGDIVTLICRHYKILNSVKAGSDEPNWNPEMEKYIGKSGKIIYIKSCDGSGSLTAFIDGFTRTEGGGYWFIRLRNCIHVPKTIDGILEEIENLPKIIFDNFKITKA